MAIQVFSYLIIIVVFSVVPPATAASSCIECHSLIHEDITAAFQGDVHAGVGLSCHDCHGGNPKIEDESAMDARYGYRGVPAKKDIPDFCGRCHSDPRVMHDYNPSLPTDQLSKYWTSWHGQRLKSGDKKAATCVSCHGAHEILPSKDPRSSVYPVNVPATCAECHADKEYMAEYNIPTDQYEQYLDSTNVHGNNLLVEHDLGSPACNDCHGNHGAAPPGIDRVALVCTQCHTMNGALFRRSPHKDAFEALEVSECAFCHQKSPDFAEPHARIHTIVRPSRRMLTPTDRSVCAQCHSRGDAGWETAASVESLLDSLDRRVDRAEGLIESVERRGLEVSDARWVLESQVLQARMELRTGIHAFNLGSYLPLYQRADTSVDQVLIAGSVAAKELSGRRSYFVIVSVLILLLVIGVAMKIRDVERVREDMNVKG